MSAVQYLSAQEFLQNLANTVEAGNLDAITENSTAVVVALRYAAEMIDIAKGPRHVQVHIDGRALAESVAGEIPGVMDRLTS